MRTKYKRRFGWVLFSPLGAALLACFVAGAYWCLLRAGMA